MRTTALAAPSLGRQARKIDEFGAPGGLMDSTDSILTGLGEIGKGGEAQIMVASDLATLEELRVRFLGKKGEVTSLLRGVGQLPPDQRSSAGARSNSLKENISLWLRVKAAQLELSSRATLGDTEWVDLTFLPNPVRRGHLHPLTLILREVKAIFSRLGY